MTSSLLLVTVVFFPVYTDLVFVSTLPLVQPEFGWQEIGGDIMIPSGKYTVISPLLLLKEASYSWFSLKHFSYRSEPSRDSRVESSRSGEILKNYLQKVCFSVFINQNVADSFFRQSCEYEI